MGAQGNSNQPTYGLPPTRLGDKDEDSDNRSEDGRTSPHPKDDHEKRRHREHLAILSAVLVSIASAVILALDEEETDQDATSSIAIVIKWLLILNAIVSTWGFYQQIRGWEGRVCDALHRQSMDGNVEVDEDSSGIGPTELAKRVETSKQRFLVGSAILQLLMIADAAITTALLTGGDEEVLDPSIVTLVALLLVLSAGQILLRRHISHEISDTLAQAGEGDHEETGYRCFLW